MFIPKPIIIAVGIWLFVINYSEAKNGLQIILQDLGLQSEPGASS